MEGGEKVKYQDKNGNEVEYTVVEPFDAEKARRAQLLETQKNKALALGVEPFDGDFAIKYYYPDELTGDEERIKKIVAGLEEDYYYSGAKTMKEWAEQREEYDVIKDSTGHDE